MVGTGLHGVARRVRRGGGDGGGGGTSTVGPALNFDPLSNVTCADGLVIQINPSFPQPSATTTVPLNFPITFERAPPPTDTTTIMAQDLIALEVLAPNDVRCALMHRAAL